MAITPEEFADQFSDELVALIATGDQAAFETAFAELWTEAVTGGTSIAQIGAEFSAAVGAWFTNQEQFADWLTGLPDTVIADPPGQPAPGWYPLTNNINIITWVACPALMTSSTAKGDPGGVTFRYSELQEVNHISFDNADPSLATKIYMSYFDTINRPVSPWLATLDNSDSYKRASVVLQSGSAGPIAEFEIVGDAIDTGTFFAFPVVYVGHSGVFADESPVTVTVSRTGDKGASMRSGIGVPDPGYGTIGDTYLRLDTGDYFGPKTGAGWGDAIPQTTVASLLSQTISAADAAALSETNAASSAGVASASAIAASTSAGQAESFKNNAETAALSAAQDASDVAADKTTVANDKATVAADKSIVAADKATVAADKGITAGFKADAEAAALAAAASASSVNADDIVARQWYYMR